MAIVFHEASKTFHLYNKKVSYIVSVLENGGLENLYYGRAIKDRESFGHHHEEMVRSHMCVSLPEPSILSRHYIRDEYPSYGTGDFRSPAYTVEQANGSRISDYKYVNHEIVKGKKE
ncbi:MAG TPA: glycoside hydrolase family 36 N-terminal domain-containing protein, partial [Lachnospiraceae bacterium]